MASKSNATGMTAVRISSPTDGAKKFSATNPPPTSAIEIVNDIPRPHVSQSGDIIVQIKATTVIRDNLTWPELFEEPPALLGNDFAGVVVETSSGDTDFQVGDEVYGMTDANRGGTWAEYALVKSKEACIKPIVLSWTEAAALPLSALTAEQALFDHAHLLTAAEESASVLVTGATGGVGKLLIQFAHAAGHHVTAASRSVAQNSELLQSLGARTIIQYDEIASTASYDAIIDTVGGEVLRSCWKAVRPSGALISVHSASWDFVRTARADGIGRDDIRAAFFIVEPSAGGMARISKAVVDGTVHSEIGRVMPLKAAREAYELCHSKAAPRGKIVLAV
jgi:NADPH2:quinone reductase